MVLIEKHAHLIPKDKPTHAHTHKTYRCSSYTRMHHRCQRVRCFRSINSTSPMFPKHAHTSKSEGKSPKWMWMSMSMRMVRQGCGWCGKYVDGAAEDGVTKMWVWMSMRMRRKRHAAARCWNIGAPPTQSRRLQSTCCSTLLEQLCTIKTESIVTTNMM